RTKRTSARRRKRRCAPASRRAKTDSRSNSPSAAWHMPSRWRRRPDAIEGRIMPTVKETPAPSPVGRATPRVDGPQKVTGRAQYASDFHFPGLLYGVPVEATIANGRVVKLDTTAAEKMPGVRAVSHRQNIGRIFRSVQGAGFEGISDERRPPFEDDIVRYY